MAAYYVNDNAQASSGDHEVCVDVLLGPAYHQQDLSRRLLVL